jgi:ribosome-binding protein aMBF1 (putative translation factor)
MITKILSRGRVALLGIAQRQVSIKFSPKTRKQKNAKPLPASIKTIGDLIQVKRMEKNLTPGHLAAKMGIATALVRSWEDGTGQPDNRQLKVLAGLLGVDADDCGHTVGNYIPNNSGRSWPFWRQIKPQEADTGQSQNKG